MKFVTVASGRRRCFLTTATQRLWLAYTSCLWATRKSAANSDSAAFSATRMRIVINYSQRRRSGLHWSKWTLQVFSEPQKKRTGLMLRAEFLQRQSWAHQPGRGRAAVGPSSARGVGAYSAAAPLLSLSDQEWGLQMGAAGGRHLEQPPFSGSRWSDPLPPPARTMALYAPTTDMDRLEAVCLSLDQFCGLKFRHEH